jgi:hypothetical protein
MWINYLGSVLTSESTSRLGSNFLCQQTFWRLPHRDWWMPNIGEVKFCLAPTQHKGEWEQDFTS